MYERRIDISRAESQSVFLWGARQTGKSTLLRKRFPKAKVYDLLLSDEYRRIVSNPELVREECLASGVNAKTQKAPIIVDEVQKVPALLDEIHWMIENLGLRFVLCGSSARKLKRGHANLLGGRALRYELRPLVSVEIPDFSLEKALSAGLLPRHYLSDSPRALLRAYVGDYLQEEIAAEALTRNIPAFSRFLEVAAFSNGETVNYNNIARECGVSAPTVKGYFEILFDTLIAFPLPAYRKAFKRRLIHAPKYYFFDVGVSGYLTKRPYVEAGSEVFGRAFEHFIHMELSAHSTYSGLHYPLSYWRTASRFEVDFLLGDAEIAIEVKSSRQVREHHLKGLRAFKEEHPGKKYIVVSMDSAPRRTEDGIDILPWRLFLERLWSGELTAGSAEE